MSFSPKSPELTDTLTVRHHPPGSSGALDIDTLNPIRGRIRRRIDAAATMTITHPNPNGANTGLFKVGDELWTVLSLYDNRDLSFHGIIPPGGVQVKGDGSRQTIELTAVDPLGMGVQDQIDLSQGQYDGWECGQALSDIVGGIPLPSTWNGTSITRSVKGTFPAVFVSPDDKLNQVFPSRKAAMDSIRALMIDEADFDNPRAYHYFLDDTNAGITNFLVKKEPVLSTAYSTRTLTYASDILTSVLQTRSDQATRATAVSRSDPTLFATYDHKSVQQIFGILSARIDSPRTKKDELMDAARRKVRLTMFPRYAYRAKVHQGYRHTLMQVVNVNDTKYGLYGKRMITELEHEWGVQGGWTWLTLAAQEELIGELIG